LAAVVLGVPFLIRTRIRVIAEFLHVPAFLAFRCLATFGTVVKCLLLIEVEVIEFWGQFEGLATQSKMSKT